MDRVVDRKRALLELGKINKLSRNMRLAADGWANDWQRLVAIVLSARARDEVTIKICEGLFAKYPTLK